MSCHGLQRFCRLRHSFSTAPSKAALRKCVRASSSSSAVQPSVASDAQATPSTSGQDVVVPAYKAAIDFKRIKDNLEAIKQNAVNRNTTADPDRVCELYDAFVDLKIKSDQIRAARNENSKMMKGKLEADQRAEIISEGKRMKEESEGLEEQLTELENLLQLEGQRIPNDTHPDVPIGADDDAATLINLINDPPEFPFTPLNHVDIGEALDLMDFESGAAVSGSKFYYLRNAAALLEMALCSWAMSRAAGAGFTPITTPDIVRASVLEKCGFAPRATNTQVYSIADSDLCLTGTAEVPLGGIYMDATLTEDQLPIKMAAFGHCFRTEAGAAGLSGKGLYRVHQFSKVEMFVLCTPAQSDEIHESLIQLERDMFTELGLHFRVLDMPSADLGAPAYRKYDVEAWMPGLGRFGEISSASNCTDFQARRLNIRYRPQASAPESPPAGGKPKKVKKVPLQFVHTLNATACAVPRMVVAILESFQQEDGSVVIPEPLRPFMGGMSIIEAPKGQE